MLARKKNSLYFFIPLFISIICLLLYYKVENNSLTYIKSETGIWDLREESLTDNIININGSIEYIPNELLTPEEFEKKKENIIMGKPIEDTGYSTRRIKILLPENKLYVFSRMNNDFANKIYVNGEEVSEIGVLGKNENEHSPETKNVLFTARSENGVVEIVQQTSNFIQGIKKEDTSWCISNLDNIGRMPVNGYKDSIKIGGSIVLLLINMSLFIFFPKIKVNLYFALFHLNYIARIGLMGQQVFGDLLGNIPWILEFKMEHITIPIRVMLLLLVMKTLFPYVLLKKERYIVYIMSCIFIFMFMFSDIEIIRKTFLICQISYSISVIYTITCFIFRRPKSIKIEGYIFLAGFVQLFFGMILDFIIYKNTSGNHYGECTSFATFLMILFGAIAIFINTMVKVYPK